MWTLDQRIRTPPCCFNDLSVRYEEIKGAAGNCPICSAHTLDVLKEDLMEVFPASLRASCILLSYTPYRVSHKQPESPLQGCLIYKNFSEISAPQRHSCLEAELKVGRVPRSSRISLSMKIISENHPSVSWSFYIQLFGS